MAISQLKGEEFVTVLYGTVEYFERQISDYLNKNEEPEMDILKIYYTLEHEILNDYFLNNEDIQEQCINNLTRAIVKLTEDHR
jgi:hypothetical protein